MINSDSNSAVEGGSQPTRDDLQRALVDVQARMGGIVDSAMDAIITVDEQQRIVQFNAAAERVFLRPRADVIGRALDMLIPQRFHAVHKSHIERFATTAVTSHGMGAQTVLYGVRANGFEFPIEASISQHVESDKKLFTAILRDVTARVRSEEALRQSQQEIQTLALAASEAREQEKRRVARELHDELGQSLTALKMDVGSLRAALAETSEPLARKLDSMQHLLDSTVAAVRRISSDLRPMMLDDLGLTAAADWLVQNFTARNGVPCELIFAADADLDLPDPYSTAIFRVLQESLTNVAKHAGATQVEVTMERAGDDVTLAVRDNGCGMVPGSLNKASSFGLTGVRERAYLLGGTLRIESEQGDGTLVEFRIPVGRRGASAVNVGERSTSPDTGALP